MMIKRMLILIILTGLISCNNAVKSNMVNVSGRSIFVDNNPFFIKGICYHPVPKGSKETSFDNIDQDLDLMVEAGINTIRVYEPIDDIIVLDKIHKAGLKLIVGFGYNKEGHFDMLTGSFLDYVKKYKDHPVILMWELGNEFNYHPEWFEGDLKNWYKTMNDAAALIHDNDSAHPVTTAHGELPDDLAFSASPNIDVWGLNVYRWDNPEDIFEEWKAVSTKPMYLSEAGGDSYMTIAKEGYEAGENEKAQADANANILDAIFRNKTICSGVTMFSFTDGWWKAGSLDTQDPGGWAPNSSGVPYDGTPNEEYWGMVDIDRNKKQTFDIIRAKYTQFNK